MLAALRAQLGALAAEVRVLDVDDDSVLLEKYDELVPFLTGRYGDGDDKELGHYFLDAERLSRFIAAKP